LGTQIRRYPCSRTARDHLYQPAVQIAEPDRPSLRAVPPAVLVHPQGRDPLPVTARRPAECRTRPPRPSPCASPLPAPGPPPPLSGPSHPLTRPGFDGDLVSWFPSSHLVVAS